MADVVALIDDAERRLWTPEGLASLCTPDWIFTNKKDICNQLGLGGTQPNYVDTLLKQGRLAKAVKISRGKWKVVFADPVEHAEMKKALKPKPKTKRVR